MEGIKSAMRTAHADVTFIIYYFMPFFCVRM